MLNDERGERGEGAENNMNIPKMDWMQVRLNGGPPCFAVGVDGNPNQFCGRAERWEGHGQLHDFVSLTDYLTRRSDTAAAREREDGDADEAGMEHIRSLIMPGHDAGCKCVICDAIGVTWYQALSHARAPRPGEGDAKAKMDGFIEAYGTQTEWGDKAHWNLLYGAYCYGWNAALDRAADARTQQREHSDSETHLGKAADRLVNEAGGVIRKIFDLGHNDDCLFCGFKDREAKRYLDKYQLDEPYRRGGDGGSE